MNDKPMAQMFVKSMNGREAAVTYFSGIHLEVLQATRTCSLKLSQIRLIRIEE